MPRTPDSRFKEPLSETAAREKLQKSLARRGLSVREARNKLVEWGVSDDSSKRIISDYIRYGWLDDQKFAEQFAANRVRRGFGWRRIAQELSIRRIPTEIITTTQQQLLPETGEDANSVLLSTAEKEWRKLSSYDPEVRTRRWLARMLRRGFDSSPLYTILRALERQEKMNVGRAKTSGEE